MSQARDQVTVGGTADLTPAPESAQNDQSSRAPQAMLALESLRDIVFQTTADGTLLLLNPAWEQTTGWPVAESVGKAMTSFVLAPDRQRFTGVVQALLAGEKAGGNQQLRFVTKAGSVRWLEMHAQQWRESRAGTVGVAGTLTDVTERRRIEQLLQTIQDQYRVVVETVREVVFQTDADGGWTFLNPAWQELTGHDVEETIGRDMREFFHVEDPRDYDVLAPLLRNRAQELRKELRLVRKDGTERWVELHARSSIDELGLLGTTGTISDISERKTTEAELLKAAERAQAASRAKSAFLANLSHEIRTPMTAVLGYAELLRDAALADDQRHEFLEVICRNGHHLLELINDILDLSKVEAGRMSFEVVDCDPVAVIDEVAQLMRQRAREKGLSFEVRWMTPIPATVKTDSARLRQIFVNLLGNAIKFTELGGVSLEVACHGGLDNSKLSLAVVDTGVGISTEGLTRLFQPFYQGDTSTARRFGGTGLGLAISKRFAEMLGGDIKVESVVGRGSTFAVTVPTGPLAGVAMRAPRDLAARKVGVPLRRRAQDLCRLDGSVLVAEDGPDNQRLLAHVLRRAGAEVVLVANGADAVERTLAAERSGTPFSVVLMDMHMPEVDGYEAAHRLRSRGCKTPIIALTANAMDGDRERCLAAGCDDFATKPIDQAKLVELLSRWL